MGEFCADAGMVGVFLLSDVLKYNPEFNTHIASPWTATVIQNFKGTVQIVVERTEGIYEEDSEWWKAGEKWESYDVHVVGNGIDSTTGKVVNFVTKQSGF